MGDPWDDELPVGCSILVIVLLGVFLGGLLWYIFIP